MLVEFVLLSNRFVLLLLLLKLCSPLVFFNFTHFGYEIHLLLEITLDQVFVLTHLFFQRLNSCRLFVKFLEDLLKDSRAFTTLSLGLSNAAKCYSELVTEVNQIFCCLHFPVESDGFVGVINDCNNQTITIALEQKSLNLFPISEELKSLLQSRKG